MGDYIAAALIIVIMVGGILYCNHTFNKAKKMMENDNDQTD